MRDGDCNYLSFQTDVFAREYSAEIQEPKLSNMNLRGDGPITPNTSYLSYTATRCPSVVHHVQFPITDMMIVIPKPSADPRTNLEAIDEVPSDVGALSS